MGTGDDPDGIQVLVLVPKNWGLNSFLLLDQFELNGWTLTFTGVGDTIRACPPVDAGGRGVAPIVPDLPVAALTDLSPYDALVLLPGSGAYLDVPDSFSDIMESEAAMELITRLAADRPVYAMCAGTRVLAAAGLLAGRRIAGHEKFRPVWDEAGAEWLGQDHPPVTDGTIITATRGLYQNAINTMAIAEAIERKDTWGSREHPPRPPLEPGTLPLQGSPVAARTFAGPGAEGIRAICPASDGGYLLVGYTFSNGSGDSDILAIRTDAAGEAVWMRTYGGAGTEYAFDCLPADDGFLITGYTTSFGAGSRDVFLVRIAGNGHELWSKTYGGPDREAGLSLCPTLNGGYLICGYTRSYGAGEEDVYLVRVDTKGTEQWARRFGGERFEIGTAVRPVEAGGYIIAASSGTTGGRNADVQLIRIDGRGNEMWSQTYTNQGDRGYGFDWCTDLEVTRAGDFVVTGYSDFVDIMDIFVKKIAPDGSELWTSSHGNHPFKDYGTDIVELPDGDLAVCGITKSFDHDNDLYLVRLTADGQEIRAREFSAPGSQWASAMILTAGGELLIAGHTAADRAGRSDVLLLRVPAR